MPVIVEYSGGVVTVKGQLDGQQVSVYNLSGQMLGSAVLHNGATSARVGSQRAPILVKIGRRTIKISEL